MNNLNEDYLKKLAIIKTPKYKGFYDEERQAQNYNYCQLRNYAKDLLENPKDKKTKKNLLQLIKKLEII